MENYVFIHHWSAEDTQYALYTEDALRRIHRESGHQSVRETYQLLKRATKGVLDEGIIRELVKISKDCNIFLRNAATP